METYINSNSQFIKFLAAHGPWAQDANLGEAAVVVGDKPAEVGEAAGVTAGVAAGVAAAANAGIAPVEFVPDQTFSQFAADQVPKEQDIQAIFQAILEHQAWANCNACAMQRTCPILRNRQILLKPWLQQRVQNLVHLLSADGHDLTIVAVQELVVNALLGQGFEQELAQAFMSCEKVESKQLIYYEDGNVKSNVYDNLLGLNVTAQLRLAHPLFKLLDLLEIGQHTSKNIDDFLLFGRPQAKDLRRIFFRDFDVLHLDERLHDAWKLLKNSDVEDFVPTGCNNNTPILQDFIHSLQAMRRLCFFNLGAPFNQVGDVDRKLDYDYTRELFTDPYLLTFYPHARDYLRIEKLALAGVVEDIRSDIAARSLVIGLNRIFTGLHTIYDIGAVYIVTKHAFIPIEAAPVDASDQLSDDDMPIEAPKDPYNATTFFRFQAYGYGQSRSLNLKYRPEQQVKLALQFESGENDAVCVVGETADNGQCVNAHATPIELPLTPLVFECLLRLAAGESAISLPQPVIKELERFKDNIIACVEPYLDRLLSSKNELALLKETRQIKLDPQIKQLLEQRDALLKQIANAPDLPDAGQESAGQGAEQGAANTTSQDDDQSAASLYQAVVRGRNPKNEPCLVECSDFILGLVELLLLLGEERTDLLRIELKLKSFTSPLEFLRQQDPRICWFFAGMYNALLVQLTQKFPQKFVLTVDGLGDAPQPLLNFAQFYEYCVQQDASIKDDGALRHTQLEFELCMYFKADDAELPVALSISGAGVGVTASTASSASTASTAGSTTTGGGRSGCGHCDSHAHFTTLMLDGQEQRVKCKSGQLIWRMEPHEFGVYLQRDMQLQLDAQAPLACGFIRNPEVELQLLELVFDTYGCLEQDHLPSGAFVSDHLVPYSTVQAAAQAMQEAKAKQDAEAASNLEQAPHAPHNEPYAPQVQVVDGQVVSFSLSEQFSALLQPCLAQNAGASQDQNQYSAAHVQQEAQRLDEAFKSLAQKYLQALKDMLQGQLSLAQAKQLYEQYAALELQILQSPLDKILRSDLLKVVQSIGMAYELQIQSPDYEFAIATPYHIRSMYQHVLRIDRAANMVERLFKQHMFISDLAVLKRNLEYAFKQIWGSEMICSPDLSKHGLLQSVKGMHGYSLYQLLSHIRQSFFSESEEQLTRAVMLMERYVRAHPQVCELFNIVLYDSDRVDVLIKLYHLLSRNEFFKSVNTCIYLVSDDLDNLSQAVLALEIERLKKHHIWRSNMHCYVTNRVEVANLKERMRIKYPHTFLNVLCDDGKPYQFDVGLVFHAFDSRSYLAFFEGQLRLSTKNNPFGLLLSNFALYEDYSKCSQLGLAKSESSWMDIVGWYVLYFMYQGEISNEDSLRQLVTWCKFNCFEDSTGAGDDYNNAANNAYTNGDGSDFADGEIDELLEPERAFDARSVSQSNMQAHIQSHLNVKFKAPVPIYCLHMDGNNQLSKILYDIHQQTDEIITFDSLLTKFQFYEHNIQQVEYQQPATGNTNIFISSGRDIEQSCHFLDALLTELEVFNQRNATQKVLEHASKLSSGLLLHSQIGAICTQEMMGIVLSHFLLQKVMHALNAPESIAPLLSSLSVTEEQSSSLILGRTSLSSTLLKPQPTLKEVVTAYFRLDEYAAWFGMQFNEIADLIALNMCLQENGRYLLRIGLVESKFYQGGVFSASNKSLKQIKTTAESILAVFSHNDDSYTVDRNLRLSQLVALMQHSPNFSTTKSGQAAIQALFTGQCDISICALSCVFIYKVDQGHPMEDITVRSFEFGDTENTSLEHKIEGVQMIFNEKATKLITDEFLSGEQSRTATMMLMLQDTAMQRFLANQTVISFDESTW